MTSENPRPYHAKDKASGQEAADAVAAVMQHAAARDEAVGQKKAPKKQPKWMLPLGINLCVLAVYLLIAPPNWIILDPIEEAPPEQQAADMGTAMWLQIQRIDSYKNSNGVLPASLAEAGSPVPGIDYRVLDPDRYQLEATAGGETITYDSSNPAAAAQLMAGSALEKIQAGG